MELGVWVSDRFYRLDPRELLTLGAELALIICVWSI